MQPLTDVLQLGEPTIHRGIALAPLFPRRSPRAEYLTFEQALPLGFRISEVDEQGAVPELHVTNPTDANVLLYDGEELVGAKQNRILNVTVLVAANSELPIPVSCVEQGRWSRRSTHFAPAAHASHPQLRRRKLASLGAQPLTPGVAQRDVWDEVQANTVRFHADAPTAANADVFASRAGQLRDLEGAFPLARGQCGAVLALGEDALCLDYVSRPEAWARLYPKLLAGYLLDALERLDGGPAPAERLTAFVTDVECAGTNRSRSAGVGDDVRVRGHAVIGGGLELDGELLQLSAFSTDERGAPSVAIARPSLRRG